MELAVKLVLGVRHQLDDAQICLRVHFVYFFHFAAERYEFVL